MKRISILAAVAAALILALVVAAAWGQAGPNPDRPNRPGGMGRGLGICTAGALMPPQPQMLQRNAEALELTTEQQDKLRDILTQGEQALVPLMQKANQASLALRNGLYASDTDDAKLKKLVADADKAEADIVSARMETWTKMRTILNAQQLTKLKELTARPRIPRAPGAGPGNPPPAGPPPAGGGAPPPPPPAQ